MKRIAFLLLACVAYTGMGATLFAQDTLDTARFVCQYDYRRQNDTIKKSTYNDILWLQVGTKVSKCFSYLTFQYDSLMRDPVGAQKLKELRSQAIRNLTKNRDRSRFMNEMPMLHSTTYVYQNYPTGKTTVTDMEETEYVIYEESLYPQVWQIEDSTKTVLNYLCQKAVCKFRGREWTAWFAPEIPVSAGPWLLGGLPGLIVEAYDRGHQYAFTMTGLRQVADQPIEFTRQLTSHTKLTPVDRKVFLKARAFKINHGNSTMAASTGVSLGADKVKHYDLIERDYNEP